MRLARLLLLPHAAGGVVSIPYCVKMIRQDKLDTMSLVFPVLNQW